MPAIQASWIRRPAPVPCRVSGLSRAQGRGRAMNEPEYRRWLGFLLALAKVEARNVPTGDHWS